jgi:CubicO group peptidase (beta-lactamase class C family)
VSRHWPQFGQHAKESVTVRQVLQHRSGLPVARSAARDALVMTDWDRSVRRIERASLTWPPGQVPAYHYISYGFILGELVRRVSGAGVADFLAAEFLGPLGLTDIHLGLPADLWSRRVPIRGRGPAARISQVYVNRRATRQAGHPGGGHLGHGPGPGPFLSGTRAAWATPSSRRPPDHPVRSWVLSGNRASTAGGRSRICWLTACRISRSIIARLGSMP